jgi:tetraacyldisaccharide-1-P 4'-kinase
MKLLAQAGHTVLDRQLLPDDPDRVRHLIEDVVGRGEARIIITTGGTGKTPTVQWLAGQLRDAGRHPGDPAWCRGPSH